MKKGKENTKTIGSPATGEAAQDLILGHRNRARKFALGMMRRWRARLELDELFSLVDLSLCEAADRYDSARGAAFATFLFYHLRGNLIRAITKSANTRTVAALDVNGEIRKSEEGDPYYSAVNLSDFDENGSLIADGRNPEVELERKELYQLSEEAKGELDKLAQEVVERILMHDQAEQDVAEEMGYSRCHISRVKRNAIDSIYDTLAKKLGPEVLPARRAVAVNE